MIPTNRYRLFLILIVLVYLAGIGVTLFENDSAQFAVMAMRMVQESDFINLIKGTEEYLDKPHLHFWLAAIAFKIFGLHDWAYRIPGILAILLAAYSTYGLGRLLYDRDTGRLASLIFMTAQTIMLAAIDVRTDAVLTGFTIFSIWQLAAYVKDRGWIHIVLGGLGAGLAFSTKGQIALLVIGLSLLCHLLYTRRWKVLWDWRILVGLAAFALAISPMLYAYYQQFDLHPEKVIRGIGERSGVLFIFWDQAFERLTGKGVGINSGDYLFLFHTFLWVFIPWTIIGLLAVGKRIGDFYRIRFRYDPRYEFLTLGGIVTVYAIISFAQFKLPHYLNILMPLFAIISAGYLRGLYLAHKARKLKRLLAVQYSVVALIFIAVLLLCFYVFHLEGLPAYVAIVLAFGLTIYFGLKHEASYFRIISVSVCGSILLNTTLNVHFYPRLLRYQAGSSMAAIVAEEGIPVETIYKFGNDHTWSLDFYNGRPVAITTLEGLHGEHDVWVYVNDTELGQLRESGFDWDRQFTVPGYRITVLKGDFLNPATRKQAVYKMHLVHLP